LISAVSYQLAGNIEMLIMITDGCISLRLGAKPSKAKIFIYLILMVSDVTLAYNRD